ncbi:Sds3-like-domain-containing protein [Xylariales sp. PMI_506]|nr:Sds3-like-domain-containing protein [Xylariales sp. PMI_506]
MATGDTAPPVTIVPPAIEPLSDDDGSSPLSDLGGSQNDLDQLDESPNMDISRDDESSEDGNDTEAETERLYPTPQNPSRQKDVFADGQVYERTPTKLRQETTARNAGLGDDEDDDDEPLSDAEPSIGSSPPGLSGPPPPAVEKLSSPTLDVLAAAAAHQEPENRKRKRSSMPNEQSEADQPLRKRTGSAAAAEQQDLEGDVAMGDDENPSTNAYSGDEAVISTAAEEEQDGAADDGDAEAEAQIEQESRARKQTRGSSKKRKSARAESNEPAADTPDAATAEEDGVHTGDDEPIEADVDEEAEAAHRNEEELERKKVAFEQLNSIERRFATFRDRLYEERLEQLNREEAMLKLDQPTHPEYLAMMECIDARRDDKLRVAEKEFELNMETLGRWAVARRAQILSQYYQDIRDSRERVIAELGQQWYAIQHERRKHANNVPEFGLRYPESQNQRIHDALAYNKEVSILSGIAKYEGMPAAPDMRGASLQELDDDFEAMARGRQPPPPPRHQPRSVYPDYGGLTFGQGLGAAGEQFLEQTPWANPNHPSNAHLLHRQPEPRKRTPPPEQSSTRRHTHQQNPFSSSTISNASTQGPASHSYSGNAISQKNPSRQSTTSPEVTRAASLLEQTSARSMKNIVPIPPDSVQGVKRETALPVAGF